MGSSRNNFYGGCGCLLVMLGAIAIGLAVAFAVAMVYADKEAGEKHETEWEEYNAQVAQLDSIQDVALRDSLIEEIPRPYIRQGGFAALFGIFTGLGVVIIASFPLAIGCILLVKYNRAKRKERELQDLEYLNNKRNTI